MNKILLLLLCLALNFLSCSSKTAFFVCDQIYAETVVIPYGVDASLKKALKTAGYRFRYIVIPVNAVLSEQVPENAAVMILSPLLNKQAEACAADHPEILFVTLDQKLQTQLSNLKGIPRNAEKAYAELGTLFGYLSRERIPDPFGKEASNEQVQPDSAKNNAFDEEKPEDHDESGEIGDDDYDDNNDEFPSEWQPDDASPEAGVILKPAVVFSNLSVAKEKNYLAFLKAFSAVNPRASEDLFTQEVPSSRDSATVNRLSGELLSRKCNLILADAGSLTSQLIQQLAEEPVLLAAIQVPRDGSPMWKRVDLVMEWDYETAFFDFFSDLTGEEKEIFLELRIKKYKKDSILYPYYAEKINDK